MEKIPNPIGETSCSSITKTEFYDDDDDDDDDDVFSADYCPLALEKQFENSLSRTSEHNRPTRWGIF